MFHVGAFSQVFFYFPASLFFWFIFFVNEQTGSLTYFVVYYYLSYFTLAGPLIGISLVTVLYLRAYIEGNSSGLFVSNQTSFYLYVAHLVTYQFISLMVNIIALPGIKVWYDDLKIMRAELDTSRQFQEEEEKAICEDSDEYQCDTEEQIVSLIRSSEPVL